MSKSLGNVVDPLKLMEQQGADILRLWTLMSDYSEDIRIGKDSLKSTGDLYRRIRNTLRFLLGALDGFTKDEMLEEHYDDPSGLPELERLMLHELAVMNEKVQSCIETYQFQKLTRELHDFCNETLSAFYFDIRKDRLYCDDPNSFERKACRSVMAMIFNGLSAWLAPILCFTADEAWSHRPTGVFEDTESVHLRDFPPCQRVGRMRHWPRTGLRLRKSEKVQEAIEPLRADKTLGSSLEAKPILRGVSQTSLLQKRDMAEVCITAPFEYEMKDESIGIEIEKAPVPNATAAGKSCLKSKKTASSAIAAKARSRS